GNTFKYHEVKDGNETRMGTAWQTLKKKSIDDFTPEEKKKAQEDFAIQAWIANWDAAGIDNTNIGIDENGQVVPTDLGGSLLYRAQGEPKGAGFNQFAPEWDSLRDSTVNQQTADLYGSM